MNEEYSEEKLHEWQKRLSGYLKPHRLEHCRQVASLAADLALRWNLPVAKAKAAGLLHDVARDLPHNENFAAYLRIAREHNLSLGPVERANPIILHAPVGAIILREEWGIDDEELLLAVAYHTVADPDMSDFAKLIFLADTAEPGRGWEGADTLRGLMMEDLDRAMCYAIGEMGLLLAGKGIPIHPRALEALAYFKRRR